ncbi:hypothetical protein AcV5_003922 [Taiwanofungus camphoratus]|nr:hypothetical protein AcV5_003922 [Antrodia cinnamomea]
MSRRILSLFFSLAAATCVSAHGFVSQVIIDGTAYAGNVPSEAADNKAGGSPIRQISTISPVKGADNPDINCGMGAQLAEVVAPANPGSNVTFQWSGGEDGGQNWPHNVGPLMTYMASCGSTSCSQFNGSTAKWFKIDELGMISGGNTWYQQDIMNGDSYSVTLPQSIAPGGYLIRHEIISLQLAMSMGGAEFYPSCTQVQIGGNGAGTPQSSQTVTFPGGYSDSDPGIYVPNVSRSPPISRSAPPY